jgi:NADH-quinone oxidoreductase subunit I
MAELVKQFASGLYNLVLGMFTTGKHLGRHAVTLQYPHERWEVPERSRGMVVLLSDEETGELNCNACMLCMRACPTGSIEIEVEKDEKGKRTLKGFKVDNTLCCFCGLCEESCNFAGIKLSTKYEFSTFDRKDLVYDMDKLQKEGRGVPYEKPVRKKPVVKKKPAPKPSEKDASAKAEPKKDEQATAEKTVVEKPKAAGEKPAEAAATPNVNPAEKAEKPAEGIQDLAQKQQETEKPNEKAESDPDTGSESGSETKSL